MSEIRAYYWVNAISIYTNFVRGIDYEDGTDHQIEALTPVLPLSQSTRGSIHKKQFTPFPHVFAREDAEKSLKMIAIQANKSNSKLL